MGTYRMIPGGIEVLPGPESYHSADGARILDGADGRVAQILSVGSNSGAPLESYELEPELVTALFQGQDRTKRELLTYNAIPKVMVDSVLAIEDRKFFEHGGINWLSLIGSFVTDLRAEGKRRGGSTLTMQLSRGFFLTQQKTYRRKLTEMLIAIELEQKLNKQQIFELYANQVYLGQRGSFSINGFGEASRSYFGKDIKEITLPEAAMIAGIIQSPNYLNPYKRPDKVMERRNVVLDSMVETGAITSAQAEAAKATPLKLSAPNVEASDAPYFVDLVKDTLSSEHTETDLNENAYRIYTTLDPDLQRAAAEAVSEGIKLVDDQVAKQRTRRVKVGTGRDAKVEQTTLPGPIPQVALVALDPHTGEVLALVGGRNYGFSQLDHAVAKRPTGSIFKPFVYAAAMNSALTAQGTDPVFTQISQIDDSPTTFEFDGKEYDPRNYKNEYHGQVTARYALQMSLEQRHRANGRDGGLRQGGRTGPERGNRQRQGHSGGRARSLRRQPARDGRRLHRAGQRRHAHRPAAAPLHPRRQRRHGRGLPHQPASGAGPARGLRDHQHDAERHRSRHRLHRPAARLPGSGGGQNRNLARCLVRRIHQQPALHRLGGL